jgi:hypothetical protein
MVPSIDVPALPRAAALFEEIDRLASSVDAVVNISKDSRLAADTCARLFPEYQRFRAELTAFDPARRHRSRLRERIGV